MTDDDAQREALRRWGDAAITHKTVAPMFPGGFLYKVGRRKYTANGGDFVAIHGVGQSWEEAFNQATRYNERRTHDRN